MMVTRSVRLLAAVLFLGSPLRAADGGLDTTFSTDGKLTIFFDHGGADGDIGSAAAQFGDGRIVVVGGSEFGEGDSDFAFAVLHPNGGLDTSFSGDGKSTLAFDIGGVGNRIDVAQAVATMPDGRVVACGKVSYEALPPIAPPPSSRLAVARLLANGNPDPTFGGGDGRLVLTPFDELASDFQNCHHLVAHPDGRIVVPFANRNEDQAGLIRLEADGDLDPTFGGDGISELVPLGPDSVQVELSEAMELPGGKYLGVGIRTEQSGQFETRVAVARYTAGGLLDPTFDGDGIALIADPNLDFHDLRPQDVALDHSGRPVVLAVAARDHDPVFLLFRLTSAGGLDSTFGFSGWTSLVLASPAPTFQDIRGLSVQGDGKVVAIGSFEYQNDSGLNDFGAMRLTSTATALDSTFGAGGRIQIPFDLGDFDVDAASGLVAGDGRPVLAGYAKVGDDYDFAVARLTNAYIFVDGFESSSTFFWSSKVP